MHLFRELFVHYLDFIILMTFAKDDLKSYYFARFLWAPAICQSRYFFLMLSSVTVCHIFPVFSIGKCHPKLQQSKLPLHVATMFSRNIELPFFPHYETEHIGGGAIRVTWFEPKFSQSHYNIHNRTNGSNACTLIAILMASKCHGYNVVINDPHDNLNIRLIHLLAISMLEGNKIHEELKKKKVLKDLNLNVPEALKYTEEATYNLVEWKSSIYMERLSRSLCENIRNNYKEWLKLNKEPNEDLYVVLIADSRTVLFLFQTKTDTISLFDSHQHSMEQGAFIAITNRDQLGHLCFWFKEVVRKCYNSDPKLYELSFLHFKETKK